MNVKILIIDDDISVIGSIGKTFTTMAQGFLVLTATSANEGLSMIKEQRPDVVLLDIRLGPKSGMDLLKDFSEYFKEPANRKYQPRYIVITAYPDEQIEKQAKEQYRVDAFLMKPVKDEEIRRVVMTSVQKILESFHNQLNAYTKGKPLAEKRDEVSRKLDEELKRSKGVS